MTGLNHGRRSSADGTIDAERIARIGRIGREVHAVCPEFDTDAFVASVPADLPRLGLSARIARTSQGLRDRLPVTGPDALDIPLRSLPPTPAAAGVTIDFRLHLCSPRSDYVSRYLRTAEHLERSLAAPARTTGYFSAEVPGAALSRRLSRPDDEGRRRVEPRRRLPGTAAGEQGHPAPAALGPAALAPAALAPAALGPADRAPRRRGPARRRDPPRRPAPLRAHLRGQPPGGRRRHPARLRAGHSPAVEGLGPNHRRAVLLPRPRRPEQPAL